jgi:branched-chain amino acid transport system substrate-binding protein
MKQRRWFTTLALVAVLSIVAAACADDGGDAGDGGEVDCATVEHGCVEVGADDPINVGVSQVISGADASLGQDQVNGIELAVDHLDDAFDGTNGQVLGHDIELTVEDDGCSAEGGQAAATALAADTSIVGVIGTSCSSGALGVSDEIFTESGITIISGSNTNPALTAEGTHQEFYARTAHNDRIQGAIVAEFTLGDVVGAQSAATVADESPYTQGLVAAFEQNFEEGGGSLTGSEQVTSTDTDFQAPLRALAEGDPDVLYFPIFVAACTLIIRQAQAIMPDTTLVVSDGCLSSDTLANAGDDAAGVYASSPDPAGTATDFYFDEFLPAYQEAFGSAPLSVFHAHAYDAFNILIDSIEEVAIENDDGSLSIPRRALRDAVFATENYQGVIGTFTCTDLGDCATDVSIGVYEAPAWPVEGGTGSDTVYSDTKSLDEVL